MGSSYKDRTGVESDALIGPVKHLIRELAPASKELLDVLQKVADAEAERDRLAGEVSATKLQERNEAAGED